MRAQWRVYRVERLAAARDGKRIKESLERALALDPAMHDAEFGVGMYRYYADVAPAVLRFLRWLLLLPGGNRVEGLQQLERAATQGLLVRGEAQFQIHVLYLWYEHKSREALEIVRALQGRYPRNPLFHQIEAEILDVYFHDPAASLRASERLLALAQSRRGAPAGAGRDGGAPQHGAPAARAHADRGGDRTTRRDHRGAAGRAGRRTRARAAHAARDPLTQLQKSLQIRRDDPTT